MPAVLYKNDDCTAHPKTNWKATAWSRLHLLILRETDGTYSAIVMNLPGTGSCGDSEEEAVANAKEAARTALEVYAESGETPPWTDTSAVSIPDGAKHKMVILNA